MLSRGGRAGEWEARDQKMKSGPREVLRWACERWLGDACAASGSCGLRGGPLESAHLSEHISLTEFL